jgi:hypothetical protein
MGLKSNACCAGKGTKWSGVGGLLDPAHAQTRGIREQVVAVIKRRPSHRTLATDSEIWREAGILSGTLARLQGFKNDQRPGVERCLAVRHSQKAWLLRADPQCS